MIAPIRSQPQFRVGQLVRHRRYGYRGVIVAFDDFCRASQQWYESNQTQPDREQPWYHVLVHDTEAVTYAAQTSLAEDPSGSPINHPLVDQFFSSFAERCYLRNERPWPGLTS